MKQKFANASGSFSLQTSPTFVFISGLECGIPDRAGKISEFREKYQCPDPGKRSVFFSEPSKHASMSIMSVKDKERFFQRGMKVGVGVGAFPRSVDLWKQCG